ncbi:7TMR-DISM family protein [Marinomonas hwangdonensis]|uniref:7TMR-DISM family protein n=1 Tax=Marinomonas hwangdonensis TaxID=1053647 RepID=UPI001F4EF181|nr:7TM diverse intracellular signaling domain-containing protein [Marinomonas hwangdonensis]
MTAFIDFVWASVLLYRSILLFLLIFSNTAWSSNTIAIIDDSMDTFHIGKSASFFIDETADLSFTTVSSEQYLKRFRPINREYLQFGLVKGNIWIRSDIAIRTTHKNPILLEIRSPRLQYLDIYLPTIFGSQVQAELGGARPYNNKQIKAPHYAFVIPTNTPSVFTVFIKMSSHLPINAEIELKTLSELSQGAQQDLTLTGIMIGVLFTLFIGNLFFFIKTSHPMYLIYGMLLIGITVLHLSLHDLVSQFFPNSVNVQERVYNLTALTCLSAIAFFSRLYLDTKSYLPRLDKLLILAGSINGLMALVYTFSPVTPSIILLSMIAVLTICILTVHAVAASINNLPYSGYYLAARTVLLTGHFCWLMSVYGFVPSATLYKWGLTGTIIIEAIIHFAGMIAQSTSIFKRQLNKTSASQNEIADLLSDISSRLRRQTNIIEGGLVHLEKTLAHDGHDSHLANSLRANKNVINLIDRVDLLNEIYENTSTDQPTPITLNQLIDNAYNKVQNLDQDNSLIEIHTRKIEQVEILQHAPILQHLIESILLECKHFTDQVLTMEIERQDVNREGVTELVICCHPIPRRVRTNNTNFDLGMYYINILCQHLNGKIVLSKEDDLQKITLFVPIRTHIRPTPNNLASQHPFDIVLLGQTDENLQKSLSMLQSNSNKIEHFSSLERLLEQLEPPATRDSGLIIIVFDNGGQIPHITQQKLFPIMRNEDQCLLISDNVKMSLDYAKKLGFDDFLTCDELDDKLEQRFSRLVQKGDRLKKAPLSRINPLRKVP